MPNLVLCFFLTYEKLFFMKSNLIRRVTDVDFCVAVPGNMANYSEWSVLSFGYNLGDLIYITAHQSSIDAWNKGPSTTRCPKLCHSDDVTEIIAVIIPQLVLITRISKLLAVILCGLMHSSKINGIRGASHYACWSRGQRILAMWLVESKSLSDLPSH